MIYLETSKTGAAKLRRVSQKNPLEVLVDLIDRDPTADFNRLFVKWRKVCEADDGYSDAVWLYAFTNYHSACERTRQKPNGRKKPARDIKKEREIVAKLIEQARPHLLLEMKMPNGKKLRECTFGEVSQFGSMFKLLAAQGKPTEIVGDKLTDADLKRLASK